MICPCVANAGPAAPAFPGVEYAYVKAYLFNPVSVRQDGLDTHIFDGTRFAQTKVGDGTPMNTRAVNAINRIISAEDGILIEGLSKCFIPRHGLVYYNHANQPVASVSICFECEGLRTYPKRKRRSGRGEVTERVIRKALKRLAALRSILETVKLPVFDQSIDYQNHLKTAPDLVNSGHAHFESPGFALRLFGPLGDQESMAKRLTPERRDYRRREHEAGPRISVGPDGSTIERIWIGAPGTKLNMPIFIGQSVSEVRSLLTGYKGPPNPETLSIGGSMDRYQVTLRFKYRTLKSVELSRPIPTTTKLDQAPTSAPATPDLHQP
jgi:hypothetical protein